MVFNPNRQVAVDIADVLLGASFDQATGALTLPNALTVGGSLTVTGSTTRGGKVTGYGITTAVAAAGSTVANAGQLGAANVVHLTSDSAAKGVKLATGAAGDVVDVINDSSTAAVLYAASGGTINGLSVDAGVVIPASKGTRCFCTAADTWIAFDMAAKSAAA